MGRILIKNGIVITMDPRRRIIKNGAVAIENDRIVDVGKSDAIKGFQAEKVFDATDRIVMPGLVDAHIHNVQMLSRGLGDDVDRSPGATTGSTPTRFCSTRVTNTLT